LRAALGAAAVVVCSAVLFALLSTFERFDIRLRLHRLSERRKFALELRVSLTLLFALAAVAVGAGVSVMLAGFAFGLVVAAIGEPRRLARQLFAITEGFLGPLFFVWLGASLQLRELAAHPWLILLGVLLGLGALLAHIAMRLTGQPAAVGALACAQLGVPVAAATLATQLDLLAPGEASALILAAVITIAVATLGGSALARKPAGEQALP
jgi:Kef-type K+ transport system membrane component KefB